MRFTFFFAFRQAPLLMMVCGPNGLNALAVAMEALLAAIVVQMLHVLQVPWEPQKVSKKFATCIHAILR